MWLLGALKLVGPFFAQLFTGGGLNSILETIDSKFDNDTKREEIKADVTKTYIQAQTQLLVGRTWWFQLFFVVPLGLWWTAVIIDSILGGPKVTGWTVTALPAPLDDWAGYIISALFFVDGTKAILGRWKGS